MNKSNSQIRQKDKNPSGVVQSSSVTQQQTSHASQSSDGYQKESVSSYTPDSLWSNFGYGLAMLAVIVVPPLIPGASVRSLIMGWMLVIVSIYLLAAIVSMIRTLRPTKVSIKGKNRRGWL